MLQMCRLLRGKGEAEWQESHGLGRGRGAGMRLRLNRQGGRMRLCTGSSMTPREEEQGHKGIAGCPGGFDSALWVNLSTSPGRRDREPTLMGESEERLGATEDGLTATMRLCDDRVSRSHNTPSYESRETVSRVWPCSLEALRRVALPRCTTRCTGAAKPKRWDPRRASTLALLVQSERSCGPREGTML